MGVVVAFDVGEEFGEGVSAVDEAAALEHFGLEAADGRFAPGVVVGIGAGGHALAQAVGGQEGAEHLAAILAAAVAVEDEARRGAAGGQSLLEGGGDQIGPHVVGQSPADDAARAEVDDEGEVEPAVLRGDEGEVADPDAVGPAGGGWSRRRLGEGASARPSLVRGT